MSNIQSKSFKTAFIISLVYSLSIMDRQIVAILFEPIKMDMQLSDTQLALMSGLVFAIFYGFMGLPFGRLADRKNRTNILAWCLGIWSLMTALSGMAANFTTLLIARIGVGIGEAGCIPASQSLIADTYDESRRARALGIVSAGIPIGGLIAYLAGGFLADAYGWRITLISVGIPGLIFALAIRFIIKEPPRAISKNSNPNTSIVPEIKGLLKNRTYRYAMFGHICCISMMYTCMMWVPTLMIRSFNLQLSEIGLVVGLATMLGGIIGSLASGVATDILSKRNVQWLGMLPMIYCTVAALFYLLFLWTDELWLAVIMLTLLLVMLNAHTPPSFAIYHKTVIPENRAMAVALSTLNTNLIGLGLAPLIIGFVSDLLTPRYGDGALRLAMYTSVFFLPLGAYYFYKVSSSLGDTTLEPPNVSAPEVPV